MPSHRLVAAAASGAALLAVATPTDAATTQQRLDRARQQLQQRQARAEVLTTDIDAYNSRIRGLDSRVDALNQRVRGLDVKLNEEQRELEAIRVDLRQQRARATRLRARLSEARGKLADRLVELYQADRPDMVTVVLNSDGFADLLEREQFLSRIATADQKVVRAVRVARTDAVEQRRRLDQAEARQRLLTASVQQRRDVIASTRTAVVDARSAQSAARADKRAALASVRVKAGETAKEVRALTAAQARVQRRLLAAQQQASTRALPRALPASPVKGGGGGPLIWPVNGTITSPFCEVRSYESCHPGLDIAAPEGTPIRAAAAGKVVLLQSVAASGGYGNYTCVQHSSSLSSCYAHQVRFGTSLGASVSQGDVIGYVGNTGRSFGAHLHWEVRVGGAVRNPLSYL